MDRRKHIRFLPQEHTIVVLHIGMNKMGECRDISLGGLSFEHIYEGGLDGEHAEKKLTLLINGYDLTKIPCRIVYDIPLPIPSEYGSLTIRLIPRRCGIEFISLTDQQMDHLTSFLKTCREP